MTHEERLTDYAATLQWDALPDAARDAVSALLIDTAGVMLAGLKSPECRNLLAQYTHWGGAKESSITGSRIRIPAPSAAYLGGVLAHWWEWDDTHDDSAVHASAVIFPTLLAVAEAAGKDEGPDAGREFVAAAAAAFDIACQIGATLVPHYHDGVMATGVPGQIGAAAGAARLLGLDEDGIMSAMGIAAEQAGLSRQPLADRVNGKNILCGLAAGQAAHSAFNAQAGIKGSASFLSGVYGLNNLFGGGKADFDEGLSRLGSEFSVVSTSIKPYPSCRSTHPGLDLTFDMMAEDPSLPERVERVEVRTSQIVFDLCGRPFEPGDDPRVAAQFSIPYTQSVALTRRAISLGDFDPANVVSDKAIINKTKSVTVQPWQEEHPGATWWWPHRVSLYLTDGSVRERDIKALRGSRARPFLPDEQEAKLNEAGKDALDSAQLQALSENARQVGDRGVASVTRLLRAAQIIH